MNASPTASLASQWFRASEASGDFMDIRYGRLPGGTEPVDWQFVSHCDCDGIGGFTRLLRGQGATLSELPNSQYPNRGILRPLWRLWRGRGKDAACADRRDWPQPEQNLNAPSTAVAWHLFSEEATAQLRDCCRQANVTVNNQLLKYLDQAVRPDTKKPEAPIPWLIPVNLRGDIRHADDTENHVSYVTPQIGAHDSPQDIQQQILQRLTQGEHRANYLMLGVGKFLSHEKKVALIAKGREKPEGNIGAFSNLGVWDADKTLATKDAWLFCPPVVKGQLLAAGCVTFQNRLSLTLQAHPGLLGYETTAQNWMTRWVAALTKSEDC